MGRASPRWPASWRVASASRPRTSTTSPEETRARVARTVAGPTWVIDGNYQRLRADFQGRVALVVWLDFPFWISFPRLVRRTVHRSLTGTRICNGNVETLAKAFTRRDSILLWALSTHGRYREDYERTFVAGGRPHVRLRGPRALARWLASPGSTRGTS